MKKIKFKNPSLVKVKEENVAENSITYLVKSGVIYLAEILDELPNGLINKTKTGVGATSIEAESMRNSIIVQPLKVTASEKAFKTPDSLYLGSPTDHFEKVSDQKILDYLNNSSIKFKKIFCVADSLERLISMVPKEMLETFFLLVDESDSIQIDSGFRANMSKVMRTYKNFNEGNRALISATPIETYDPKLLKERKTIFEFEEQQIYKLRLLQSSNFAGTVVDEILLTYKSDPSAKIVVAFNSVTGLKIIADYLTENGVPKEEITILCGENSKEKVSDYNNSLTGGLLSTRITLKTSAYFTGFDIDEPYHLIILTDNSDPYNILSVERILQISGRARKGLISFTIVQSFSEEVKDSTYSLEGLLEESENQILMLRCLTSIKTLLPISVQQNAIEGYFERMVIKGYNLVNVYNDGAKYQFEMSFLAIDAIMHLQKTKATTYLKEESLREELIKRGHTVIYEKCNSLTKVDGIKSIKEISAIKKRRKENALDIIRNDSFRARQELRKAVDKDEILIFKLFIDNIELIPYNQLVQLIESACTGRKITSNLELLKVQLIFHSMMKDAHFAKIREKLFPIGDRIYHHEVDAILKEFYDAIFLPDLLPGGYNYTFKNKLKQILKVKNVPFKATRSTKPYFIVEGYNPFEIEIEKKKFEVESFVPDY